MKTKALLAVPAVVILMLLSPAPAGAHVVAAGADLRVTQTFGAGEVTLVVTGVSRVPAPLRVRAWSADPVEVVLELVSRVDGRTSTGAVTAGGAPVALPAVHTGPHELRVRVGDEVSVLPFLVQVPASAWWTMVSDGAVLALGLVLVGRVLSNRTPRLLACAAGAAASVAVLLTLLAPYLPPDGAAPATDGGRPYALGRFGTQPARPVAGTDFTVTVRLADGATGRPVDDLAVHHEALAHLVITSRDGVVFRHLHPLRRAPGVLAVELNLPRPGRYHVHAEIERQGSGGQLLAGAFEVSGAPTTVAAGPEPATHRLAPAAPVAGSPVTVDVGTERPVRPWLGMPGHLVVRSEDGVHLAHVHGTAAGRSLLRFTVTLPAPGRYLVWVQYSAGGPPVTRAFTMEVAR